MNYTITTTGTDWANTQYTLNLEDAIRWAKADECPAEYVTVLVHDDDMIIHYPTMFSGITLVPTTTA